MVIRSSGTFLAMGIYSPLEPACSLVSQPRIQAHCDLFRAPEVRVLLLWVRFSPEADPEILPHSGEKEFQSVLSGHCGQLERHPNGDLWGKVRAHPELSQPWGKEVGSSSTHVPS